tara:strand:- start:105 stop:329 length:225 start_codon:yes stop_codon:yes gene_type:complete
MSFSIKKFIFALLFNSSLLVILIIGIQNSSNQGKVNFIINETVKLPISFIIGISFISGSLLGNIINITELLKEK